MAITHPSTSVHEHLLRLLHKTVFLFDRHADKLLNDRLSSTFSQYLILLAVARHPGLSQQHIADFLNLTPAAISRMVNNLVKEKLVSRTEDPDNRRMHTVCLTQKGEVQFEAMHFLLHEATTKTLEKVPSAEITAASATLRKMLLALDPECAYCESECSQTQKPLKSR